MNNEILTQVEQRLIQLKERGKTIREAMTDGIILDTFRALGKEDSENENTFFSQVAELWLLLNNKHKNNMSQKINLDEIWSNGGLHNIDFKTSFDELSSNIIALIDYDSNLSSNHKNNSATLIKQLIIISDEYDLKDLILAHFDEKSKIESVIQSDYFDIKLLNNNNIEDVFLYTYQ